MDCNCNQCQPSRHDWLDREDPGPFSTIAVVLAVLALVVFLVGR